MSLESFEVVGRTDVGRLREHNEDALDSRLPEDPSLARRKGLLAVVADGMGGHAAGEVASRIAVETIVERYFDADADVASSLRQAIATANERILEAAAAGQGQAGMGTTCVCAVVHDDRLTIGHVGDSRAYRWRQGQIERLTVDHSWVEEQLQRGSLSEEAARIHPYRNVITRALGSHNAEPELHEEELRPGDIVLLCTDGLTGEVTDDEIASIIASAPDLEAAAERLIDGANDRGGHDNISVLLLRTGRGQSNVTAPPTRDRASRRLHGSLLMLLVAVLGAVGMKLVEPGTALSPTVAPSPIPSPTATPAATILPIEPAPAISPTPE